MEYTIAERIVFDMNWQTLSTLVADCAPYTENLINLMNDERWDTRPSHSAEDVAMRATF